MDPSMQLTRDPLTVPVSEATPEELDIQADHHATEAAYNTLSELREDYEFLEAAGLGETLELERRWGGRAFTSLRPFRIFRLRELDDRRTLVFHVEQGRRKGGYGWIQANSTTLHTLYMDQLVWAHLGKEGVREVARFLNELRTGTDLDHAMRLTRPNRPKPLPKLQSQPATTPTR